MKTKFLLGVILMSSFTSIVFADAASKPNVLQWPRMKADKFGCYLEAKFGIKDPIFNCTLSGYSNKGDPCNNTDAYYEGPSFPADKVKDIHPLVESIDLSWEHGDLREVTLQFSKQVSLDEIKKILALPSNFTSPPEYPNIATIDVQDCSKKNNCLTLEGFEHMGAADVECEKSK